MKRCPRCQTDNPDSASFCMKCGQTMASMPVPPLPSAPRASKAPVWIGLAALVLLIAGLGLGMSGLLSKFGQAPTAPVLAKEGEFKPPKLLQVESEAKPGVLQRDQKGMPADIRAWLEHLDRIERKRKDLTLHQIGEFTVSLTTMQVAGAMDALKGLMDGSDPMATAPEDSKPESAERFHQSVMTARDDWKKLQAEFSSMPPPSECMPIRDQYDIALRETSGMMLDLLGSMDAAMSSTDPGEQQKIVGQLNAMKGSSDVIDKAGRETDSMVAQICAKYETPKWFSIAGDIGSGGMLGAPGL